MERDINITLSVKYQKKTGTLGRKKERGNMNGARRERPTMKILTTRALHDLQVLILMGVGG